MSESVRMKQLDALRALAVAAVLYSHFVGKVFIGQVHLGTLGVWLFFVLSGFLITGILLRQRDLIAAGQTDSVTALQHFFVRRFLRILPIYYLVLVVAWAAGLEEVRSALGWHLAYASNVHQALHGSWGEYTAHLWSLSVEEQFYLVWPALVLFVPVRYLGLTMFGAIALATIYRTLGMLGGLNYVALDVLTPAAFDALGIGAVFAYLCNRQHLAASRLARFERLALSCGALTLGGTLLLGAWSGLVASEQGAWYLRSAQLTGWALLFVWVVARCARGAGGAVGRVLEWRALRYLGRISYGIYLYHLFVPYFWWRSLAAAGVDIGVLPPLMLAALFVASTVLLAALSWHYLELPVDRFKERFRRDPAIPRTDSKSTCRPRGAEAAQEG
jgi:peptidoglycan/LPS O-acetylase OafA/YrhL